MPTAQEAYAQSGTWPTYRVKSGDSLTLIVWRFGREPEEIGPFYQVNAETVGRDPHAIDPALG